MKRRDAFKLLAGACALRAIPSSPSLPVSGTLAAVDLGLGVDVLSVATYEAVRDDDGKLFWKLIRLEPMPEGGYWNNSGETKWYGRIQTPTRPAEGE